ncbi:MAG: MbnP family protein [Bacteroidales bacterium]|jgi:hypothetical protein
MIGKIHVLLLSLTLLLFGCNKNDKEMELSFKFRLLMNQEELELNKVYTNSAGNDFIITDLKFFISNITLQRSDETFLEFDIPSFVHLVDIKDKSTLNWTLPKINQGVYKKIGFNFGLDENVNNFDALEPYKAFDVMKVNNFDEFGFFYMKLDLLVKDNSSDHTDSSYKDFKCYLCKCPILGTEHGTNLLFDEFYFNNEFSIPFKIKEDSKKEFIITLDFDDWFADPNIIDFSDYLDVDVTTNQVFQTLLHQNGKNVFSMRLNNKK